VTSDQRPGSLEIGPRGEAVVDAGGGEADGGGGVAFGEPLGEFGADAGLEIDKRGPAFAQATAGRVAWRYGRSGRRRRRRRNPRPILRNRGWGTRRRRKTRRKMDGGGGIFWLVGQIVDGRYGAGGVEMPFGKESVGGDAAVERAGGDAVEIGDVTAADSAETIQIEVRVFGFKRIEGPFDEADAAAERVFALEKLEETADTAIAMRGEHGGHVGVEVGGEAVEADDRFGEADEMVALESAEHLAARVMGNDKGGGRLDVEFWFAPDFAGDLDAKLEFVKGVEVAEVDVGHKSFQI